MKQCLTGRHGKKKRGNIMTYREALLSGEKILDMAQIVDAKNDAWLLMEMVCKIDKTFYYVHMDEEIPVDEMKEYESVLKERREFHFNI